MTVSIFNGKREDLIFYFYKEESVKWHLEVHKNGGTKEENLKDTCNSIEDGSEIYTIYDGETLCAFFVKYETEGKQVLNGFHVLKEYRSKHFLTEFWQIVKSKFEGSIYTGLYCKNEPAIKSLMKAGFVMNNLVLHSNKVFLILKIE